MAEIQPCFTFKAVQAGTLYVYTFYLTHRVPSLAGEVEDLELVQIGEDEIILTRQTENDIVVYYIVNRNHVVSYSYQLVLPEAEE